MDEEKARELLKKLIKEKDSFLKKKDFSQMKTQFLKDIDDEWVKRIFVFSFFGLFMISLIKWLRSLTN